MSYRLRLASSLSVLLVWLSLPLALLRAVLALAPLPTALTVPFDTRFSIARLERPLLEVSDLVFLVMPPFPPPIIASLSLIVLHVPMIHRPHITCDN